ncbi:retrovirus-related Pol polyprotein from type-2 retrotransposable element R2DM [Caerostris darwini]|uniref:Retrovirus-related Pol polyprotein from type-2 retrotransposable element R2DM n=1 Tax=Caerostris darwini TaxID=1538125 RepID=A0AAV4UYR9_9ARAC|nr:retrovirus-related Pol polyprotein from type-2 retrotransposable element R2DM [Caerostris darwini]
MISHVLPHSLVFFSKLRKVSVSPHPGSQLPKQRSCACPDGSDPLIENYAVGEVDLFPSDVEVRDLFPDPTTSPRFDFLKLTCLQCQRKFFSAGGLENHLYAVHDVRLNSSDDIPISAGHSSQTAKPVITSSQPWAGQQLGPKSVCCTTPRRPVPSKPSRVTGETTKSAIPTAPIHEKKARKRISFKEKPDQVSHPVLLPLRPPQKEDEFNRLHGIASNSNTSDFDDFVLPRPPSSKPNRKSSKTVFTKKQHSISSSSQSTTATRRPSETVGPTLSCHLCDREGFPNCKALKYHLFRLHQIPMGKPVIDIPSPSLSPGPSHVRNANATSPAEETPLTNSPHSFGESAGTGPQVSRNGQTVTFRLPLVGADQCPDCFDTFSGKEWYSIKGSITKHLKFKHKSKPSEHNCFANVGLMIKPTDLQHQCPECTDCFTSSQGLRNHLAVHKKTSALQVATTLSIPSSRRKKRRKKRRSAVADSPSRDDNQVDANHSLAPPVRDSSVPPSQDAPIDEERRRDPLTIILSHSTISFHLTPQMTLFDSWMTHVLKSLLKARASYLSKNPGALIKHLRFVHQISIASCDFKCDICNLTITGKLKEHLCFASEEHPLVIDVQQELQCSQCDASFSTALGLQNHTNAHLRHSAVSQITPLSIPASRRRKRSKRKRASSSPQSDAAHECVRDNSQLLAPPVDDVPLVEAAPQPSDHDDEPLFHFAQIFDILTCDPSQDCSQLLSEAYSQLVAEASIIALPKASKPAPFTESRSFNIDDPQQCQRLYKRNRRRAIREIQKSSGERCSLSPSTRRSPQSSPSVAEVMTAFRSCQNTAPGPDRLTFNHWRSLDPRWTLVVHTVNEIISVIPPCTPPCALRHGESASNVLPCTIIQVEDSESVLPHPRPQCDTLGTCVCPEASDTKHSGAPSGQNNDSAVGVVTLFPSDLEVRDLFYDSNTSLKFDFIKLTCLQYRRRFFSAGGFENHLFAVHGINLDSTDDVPSHRESAPQGIAPSEELFRQCPNTGPPSCAPFTKIVPAKTWALWLPNLPSPHLSHGLGCN